MKIYIIKKIITLIFLTLFSTYAYSIENQILYKIDNDIITSIDLEKEINYLSALNPNIKNLEKNKIKKLSMDSLIREKIKLNELLKYLDTIDVEDQYLNLLIESMFIKLELNSFEEFKEYLKINGVKIQDVKKT